MRQWIEPQIGGESGGESGGASGGRGGFGLGGQGWLWAPGGGAPVSAPAAPFGWLQPSPTSVNLVINSEFAAGGWDPLLKAAAVATEFLATPGWQIPTDPGPPVDLEPDLRDEVSRLWRFKVSERDARAQEITAQANDFTGYFGLLAGASPTSRPRTWDLILTALQIGGAVAAYYKLKYNRARPVQVWSALAPAIATPGHPSYPSGHATQSWLIAFCLQEAVPALGETARSIADRIAHNREVAGVHWPSDSAAGRKIAEAVFAILVPGSVKGPITLFNTVLDDAKAEWPPKRGAEAVKSAAPPLQPYQGP
jgi:hypothetical protein